MPEAVRFGASGGSWVSVDELRRIRTSVVEIANEHGFSTDRSPGDYAGFDAAAAAWFAQFEALNSGEALRGDVWAFLATALLPDVVVWRFGEIRARFRGGVRNTFQRLWIRGKTLDRGEDAPNRWELLSALSEDALVQIIERPSITADRQLALALAEG